MSRRVEREPERLVERWLSVMSANSGLLFDDALLRGDVHHIQLDVQI